MSQSQLETDDDHATLKVGEQYRITFAEPRDRFGAEEIVIRILDTDTVGDLVARAERVTEPATSTPERDTVCGWHIPVLVGHDADAGWWTTTMEFDGVNDGDPRHRVESVERVTDIDYSACPDTDDGKHEFDVRESELAVGTPDDDPRHRVANTVARCDACGMVVGADLDFHALRADLNVRYDPTDDEWYEDAGHPDRQ